MAPLADWIEVGTSLVKRYGVDGLAQVVDAAGGTPVLADLKTADDAAYEFALAYDAGAASATVLGLAADVTLDTAVRIADERGREVVVDLMELPPARRAALAARLPAHVVLAAHVGKDAQASGCARSTCSAPWADGRRLALAGGLTAADLPALADLPDVRVIVGSAVTKADDPVAAVQELRAAARLRQGAHVDDLIDPDLIDTGPAGDDHRPRARVPGRGGSARRPTERRAARVRHGGGAVGVHGQGVRHAADAPGAAGARDRRDHDAVGRVGRCRRRGVGLGHDGRDGPRRRTGREGRRGGARRHHRPGLAAGPVRRRGR